MMQFCRPNAVIGKPDKPTVIDFTNIIPAGEGWYTIYGLKLSKKPTQRGVYIHNGKKFTIK